MADDIRTQTRHQEIRLWADAPPPTTLPAKPPESSYVTPEGVAKGTTMLRNVSEPTLTVFRPRGAANGAAVVVCPGGGWRILAWEHEGLDVAQWFADRGFTALLLKYRVGPTPETDAEFFRQAATQTVRLDAPLTAAQAPKAIGEIARDPSYAAAREACADDGRRALAIARDNASQWGVDPSRIGLIGFSAGAFLVADVAVDPRAEEPPAFLAAIYGGETRGQPVPKNAPPLFTTIAHDDRLLFHMVEGLYADWSAADISSSLYIFPRGGHGFGMVRQGAPTDRWLDLLEDWLVDKGFGPA
ncbi:MAG TPA: alpha/beta hydrolase [Caulobacteraceae bacterium]|jgi:acetyl esterase/lipase